MAAANIHLPAGQKADRKLEMLFVNVGAAGGSGGSSYDWELLGRGVEDSSLEFNHDVEQTTDILGMTDTEVSPSKPSQEFDPNTIRGGQKLNQKLLDIERRQAISELSTFDVLLVHAYLGESADGPFAAGAQGGDVLPLGADGTHVGEAGHLIPILEKDLQQLALGGRFALKCRLVRLIAEQDVTYCHWVTHFFQPFSNDT